MDFQERSPRRKLQRPRPTPLRINKDSHKIKKPLLLPMSQLSLPHSPLREPIIIYMVSPKVIHTTPGDFRNLVQSLTGLSSSLSSSSSLASLSLSSTTLIPSPIEKARSPMVKKQVQPFGDDVNMFQGITASSLSPISSSLFSSPSLDPSMVSFIHEFSPTNFVSPHTPSTDLFNYFNS